MERQFRLSRTTDFMRVRRSGKSHAHPLIVLISAQNDEMTVRIGISASHMVGNAVQRNRAKRRIRACARSLIAAIRPGTDVIWIARRPIEQASYQEIYAAMRSLLIRAGLLEVV